MADKSGRAVVWTFIVYPESAPENWRSLLDDLHVLYMIKILIPTARLKSRIGIVLWILVPKNHMTKFMNIHVV